jgi:hypothetical protein
VDVLSVLAATTWERGWDSFISGKLWGYTVILSVAAIAFAVFYVRWIVRDRREWRAYRARQASKRR